MLGRIQQARRKILKGKTPYRAVLGDGGGNIYAGDGQYWVRPYDGANTSNIAQQGAPYRVRAGSALIVPRAGRVVWIGYGLDNRLTIMGYDHDDLVQAGINPTGIQPNDPYREWVRFKNIQNFRALPISVGTGMLVQVRQLFYLTATGDLVRWNGTNASTHIDLTSYVPGGGYQRYVVLWLRAYNPSALDDIQVTYSSPISSINDVLSFTDLQACTDQADADTVPIQAFRLANAQTLLKMDDTIDLDLRQLVNMPQVYGFPNAVSRAYRVHEAFSVVAPSAVNIESGGLVQIQDNALLKILSAEDDSASSGGGSTTTFNASGSTGTNPVITDGDTLAFVGSGGISTSGDSATKKITIDGSGITGGMTSWTLSADSGTTQTVDNAETVTIEGGDGVDTVVGATNKVTVAVDSSVVRLTGAQTLASKILSQLVLLIGGFKATFTHAFTADHTVTIPGDANVTLVGEATTQTLTGKTIDGDDNTLQDIALTAIKTVGANVKRFISRDASGAISDETNPPLDNLQHDHSNAAGGGNITGTAFGSQPVGNLALMTPDSTSGIPSFRALIAEDLIGGNILHTIGANPGVTSDDAHGYSIGSQWINTSTNESFICTDNSTGTAVWKNTTVGASAVATNLFLAGPAATASAIPTFRAIDKLDLTSPLQTPPNIGQTTPALGYFSALRLKIGGFFGIFTHSNTADRTYTFPDVTGTVALLAATQAMSNKTIDTSDIGTTTPGQGYFSALREKIGGFFAIFTHANSADRTYTLPDATGTVALTSDLKNITTTIKTSTTPGTDTWTKPANCFLVRVLLIGAGGGGGGGIQRATSTAKSGGGGGGAGYLTDMWYSVGELPSSSYSFLVGTGGTGGTATTTGNPGVAGNPGGDSYFGGTTEATALQTAKGGGGGAAGTSTTAPGGTGASTFSLAAQFYGADGGGGVTNGTAGVGGRSAFGPGGGGGASGRNTANTNGTASAGGSGAGTRFGTLTGGGGAVNSGATGSNGANGDISGTVPITLGSGGGGGDFNASTASNGGNGGLPGGGGGGGAGAQGSASGVGGNGGNGGVLIIAYCYA